MVGFVGLRSVVFWVSSSSATAWPTLLKPMWQRSGKCKRESRLPALVKENATKTRVFGAFGCFARVPFFFYSEDVLKKCKTFLSMSVFFSRVSRFEDQEKYLFCSSFCWIMDASFDVSKKLVSNDTTLALWSFCTLMLLIFCNRIKGKKDGTGKSTQTKTCKIIQGGPRHQL